MDDDLFDIAVIGGGPAGMMAAGRAAELGASVVLIEKNAKPGRKLLMTGNGRCNLTQAEYDTRRLVEKYGRNGKFLFSAFTAFGVRETLDFFHDRGLATRPEDDGRIFPASEHAGDVLNVLMGYTQSGGVTFFTGHAVAGLEAEGGRIKAARLADGSVINARSFIICTGGKSYPATGSTGEGFEWLAKLGHTITPLKPSLAPITVKEAWLRDAEGASFAGAALTIYQSGKKKATVTGDGVFTRNGISGPAALNASRDIGELMESGEVTMTLDLLPGISTAELDNRVRKVFGFNMNRLIRNIITELVTPKLAPVFMKLAGIDPESQVNKVSREQRLALVKLVKGLPMTVAGVGGFDRAMVTRGGVSLKEVDSKTMRSKLTGNLFLAGEVLDIEGPTGGYNLQACWSTGYVAGTHAERKK
jgi:hypothetical protein